MHSAQSVWDDVQCLDIPTVFRKLNHVSCDDDSWLEAFEYFPEQRSVDALPNFDAEQLNVPTFLRRPSRSIHSLDQQTKPKPANDYQRLFEVLEFRLNQDEQGALILDSLFELEHIGLTSAVCKRLVKLMLKFEIPQQAIIGVLIDHILCVKEPVCASSKLRTMLIDIYRSIDEAKLARIDLAIVDLLSQT